MTKGNKFHFISMLRCMVIYKYLPVKEVGTVAEKSKLENQVKSKKKHCKNLVYIKIRVCNSSVTMGITWN